MKPTTGVLHCTRNGNLISGSEAEQESQTVLFLNQAVNYPAVIRTVERLPAARIQRLSCGAFNDFV